ncbi:MAG: hypothetical protein LBB84_04200 [Tannerellaceae bacterium]|nr:hypothetical protein [Tannerellaceae bacterium]
MGEPNAWSAEHTHNRIPTLFDQLDPDIQAYLIHALYFKALWSSPFAPEYTKEEPFANANGSVSQIPTMYRKDVAFAYRGELFDALELNYMGGEYSMVVVLPKEGVAISSVEKQLGIDSFRKLLEEMYLCEVSVKLPKFKIAYERKLNKILERMTGNPQFGHGDYSLLSPSLSDAGIVVVQKTFAEIDEKGTEAAAVTYVGLFTSAGEEPAYPKIEFHVHRPFLFFIHEKSTGAILFAGRILNL